MPSLHGGRPRLLVGTAYADSRYSRIGPDAGSGICPNKGALNERPVMKSITLATMVVAALFCSSGTADAQFRSRGSRVQSYQSYPTYSYPSYYGNSYAPSYYGNSYAPSYYDGGVVTSGYTPTPSTVLGDVAGSYLNQVLPGSYTPSYAYPSSYGYNGYSSPTYYGSSSRGIFGRRR
jgi:hypothetical protein